MIANAAAVAVAKSRDADQETFAEDTQKNSISAIKSPIKKASSINSKLDQKNIRIHPPRSPAARDWLIMASSLVRLVEAAML